ncbi:hypothetical protein DFJ74DRAFT_56925 [Hyaloraphidium curvatum]|nr:hypothetical protein DFJ74DRAFT_56925 [Hyaloraphidium curvatum]
MAPADDDLHKLRSRLDGLRTSELRAALASPLDFRVGRGALDAELTNSPMVSHRAFGTFSRGAKCASNPQNARFSNLQRSLNDVQMELAGLDIPVDNLELLDQRTALMETALDALQKLDDYKDKQFGERGSSAGDSPPKTPETRSAAPSPPKASSSKDKTAPKKNAAGKKLDDENDFLRQDHENYLRSYERQREQKEIEAEERRKHDEEKLRKMNEEKARKQAQAAGKQALAPPPSSASAPLTAQQKDTALAVSASAALKGIDLATSAGGTAFTTKGDTAPPRSSLSAPLSSSLAKQSGSGSGSVSSSNIEKSVSIPRQPDPTVPVTSPVSPDASLSLKYTSASTTSSSTSSGYSVPFNDEPPSSSALVESAAARSALGSRISVTPPTVPAGALATSVSAQYPLSNSVTAQYPPSNSSAWAPPKSTPSAPLVALAKPQSTEDFGLRPPSAPPEPKTEPAMSQLVPMLDNPDARALSVPGPSGALGSTGTVADRPPIRTSSLPSSPLGAPPRAADGLPEPPKAPPKDVGGTVLMDPRVAQERREVLKLPPNKVYARAMEMRDQAARLAREPDPDGRNAQTIRVLQGEVQFYLELSALDQKSPHLPAVQYLAELYQNTGHTKQALTFWEHGAKWTGDPNCVKKAADIWEMGIPGQLQADPAKAKEIRKWESKGGDPNRFKELKAKPKKDEGATDTLKRMFKKG